MNALPHIDPILPKKGKEGQVPLDSFDWIYDLKNDGYRGVLYCDGTCTIRTKKDKRHPVFAVLEKRLASCLSGCRVVLDGEVCSLDPSNRSVFADLQAWRGNITYIAFDILWLDGQDLRHLPLSERKAILGRFITKKMTCMSLAVSTQGKGSKLLLLTIQHDLEGIIAKRADGAYAKRTRWFKVLNSGYSQTKDRHKRFALARRRT